RTRQECSTAVGRETRRTGSIVISKHPRQLAVNRKETRHNQDPNTREHKQPSRKCEGALAVENSLESNQPTEFSLRAEFHCLRRVIAPPKLSTSGRNGSVLPGADTRSAGFPTCRIANFQSADAAKLRCHTVRLRLADWKSVIQQIGNLRYSRARLIHYFRREKLDFYASS